MAILSMTEIMAAEDVTEKEVPVSEWGGSVVVRSISHKEMRKIKKRINDEGSEDVSEDELEIQIIVSGMVNPSVTREEAELMMEKSSSAIMKVLNAILGQSKADGDKSVKEEEKNFRSESE